MFTAYERVKGESEGKRNSFAFRNCNWWKWTQIIKIGSFQYIVKIYLQQFKVKPIETICTNWWRVIFQCWKLTETIISGNEYSFADGSAYIITHARPEMKFVCSQITIDIIGTQGQNGKIYFTVAAIFFKNKTAQTLVNVQIMNNYHIAINLLMFVALKW